MQDNPFNAHYVSIANKLYIGMVFIRLVSSCTESPEQRFMLINEEPPMLISRIEFLAYSDGRPVKDIDANLYRFSK